MAGGLSVDTSAVTGSSSHGTISLPDGSNAFTFAAITNGGSVNLAEGGTITIGTVGSVTGIDTTDAAATAAGAAVMLASQGGITINNNINAGQAGVQLVANTAAITEGASATITAGSLAVVDKTAGVTLGSANVITGASSAAGTFAASLSPASTLELNNTGAGVGGLQIGTVTLTGVAATQASDMWQNTTVIGITDTGTTSPVASGTVSIGTLGQLTIASAVNVPGGIAEFGAAGGISESGVGITAGILAVLAKGGDITL